MRKESGGTTWMDAVATGPLPPLDDTTADVMLILSPRVVPVTLTVTVHVPLASSVAPDTPKVVPPATPVRTPPVHVVANRAGVDKIKPAGRVSLTPTLVSAAKLLGLLIVRVKLAVPP